MLFWAQVNGLDYWISTRSRKVLTLCFYLEIGVKSAFFRMLELKFLWFRVVWAAILLLVVADSQSTHPTEGKLSS